MTFLATAFAEQITVPVQGLIARAEPPAQIECEWDEKWFSESDSFEYNHNIARIACLLAEVSYVDVSKNPNQNALHTIYKKMGFAESNIEFHYDIDYESTFGNDQSAVSFAKKDNLIFVVIRGTPLSANEWISNLNISDTTQANITIHEGFNLSAELVYEKLVAFLKKHNADPKKSTFLFTGHSRGASIANLISYKLANDSSFDTSRIFSYTFACANVTTLAEAHDAKYGFIWNIVSGEDFIPSLPPNFGKWTFKKFGRSKILANAWNTESQKFNEEYLPKINVIYNKILGRDYQPFKTGTYLPVQLSRTLTYFYPEVKDYYKKFVNLRSTGELIVSAVFPEKNDSDEKAAEKSGNFGTKIVNLLTNGKFSEAENTFIDMHACESYLATLFALNENEVFGTIGSTQLIIEGDFEMAVLNSKNQLLANVYDGKASLTDFERKVPVLTLNGKTIVGFAGNQDFKAIFYKDSVFPVSVTMQIQHFDAEGILTDEGETQKIVLSRFVAKELVAGKQLLTQNEVNLKKLTGIKKHSAIKSGKLLKKKFEIHPQFSLETNKNLNPEFGISFGNKVIYAQIYAEKELSHFALKAGVGHQENLFAWSVLNFEGLIKCAFTDSKSLCPELRAGLSFKPANHFQIFASGVFDFNLTDDNKIEGTDKNLRIGIKF